MSIKIIHFIDKTIEKTDTACICKILISEPMQKRIHMHIHFSYFTLKILGGFHFRRELTYRIIFHLRNTPEESYYQCHSRNEENEVQRHG